MRHEAGAETEQQDKWKSEWTTFHSLLPFHCLHSWLWFQGLLVCEMLHSVEVAEKCLLSDEPVAEKEG